MDPLTERLKRSSGGKILDTATGHGDFLDLMVNSFNDFNEAVGIDISGETIGAARKRFHKKYRFEVMDAEKIGFDDDYFDTVAIRHSLHHLENVNIVLKEMERVLKPDGLFVICEVFQSPDIVQSNSQRHLHHWWAEVDRARGIYHNKTFTKEEILKSATSLNLVGLEIIEYIENISPHKKNEILTSMLRKCDMYIDILRGIDGCADLMHKGEVLIDRFKSQGFTPEKALYILGRK